MNLGLPRLAMPPLPPYLLLLLAGCYLFAGIAHDPWKTEDAIHLGIAYGFASEGHWLFPHLAGEAWPHSAPLYHWVAALSGQLFGGFIEFHNAARLATPLFGGLFFFALSKAASAFHGIHAGRIAALLAMGTLGLLVPLHEAQPAIAGLACAALAWWGGALIMTGERRGAILLGAGLGLSFLAQGLAGLLMAITVLAAPIFRRDWKALGITLLCALPLLCAWPFMLFAQEPTLWLGWWRNEFAASMHARNLPTVQHLKQLLWATWPILPLAGWGIWVLRHAGASLGFPLAGALIGLSWYLTGSSRTLALLPMLIPLTLLAASGTQRLRRGAANAFDWFAVVTFSCAAVLIWLGASAQVLGWPARIARNFEKLAPGHTANLSPWAWAIAIAVSLAWIVSARLPRAPWRASLRWAGGTLTMWALLSLLWLPWIEHYKTYRPVVFSLRAALPDSVDCIERHGIGPAQRAVLDYFVGIRTVPPQPTRHCRWRLTIGNRNHVPPSGWAVHWHGHRPSDRNERWYLEKRIDSRSLTPSENSAGST